MKKTKQFGGFLKKIFKKKIFMSENDRMIIKRLNETIKSLEHDYQVYNLYHINYRADDLEKILKELKYIKTGKK